MGLEKMRHESGLTRRDLANKSGVHLTKIHQIEQGVIKIENITLRNALKLANALSCRPKDLLNDSQEVSESAGL
jgi:DNA-binding Xre family transcriptional regulator